MTRSISILGATGSVGASTLDLVRRNPESWSVEALTANSNVDELAALAREFKASVAVIADESLHDVLKAALAGSDVEAATGRTALGEAAARPADIVMAAIVGCAGLAPVMAAIQEGRTVALANKEVLVMAGGLVMDAARRHGVSILPVDSEHNAIHQCLQGRPVDQLKRLILTASGGPLREWSAERLHEVTPADALAHPTWQMGRKISVDSATLMNKGLEVIEATWLFDVSAEQVDVVVHPQSVVHSLVELIDGSQIAQLGVTDMRLPIQYAFSYPDRWDTALPGLDLACCGSLEFSRPDTDRFPCLKLAYQALRGGTALPVALNAANEVAVDAFLAETLPFAAISDVITQALEDAEAAGLQNPTTLNEVRQVDTRARQYSRGLIAELQSDK